LQRIEWAQQDLMTYWWNLFLWHFSVQPLSDEEHFTADAEGESHHNVEFDHEAFLGKDEEKTFDQLTPEESKERLG